MSADDNAASVHQRKLHPASRYWRRLGFHRRIAATFRRLVVEQSTERLSRKQDQANSILTSLQDEADAHRAAVRHTETSRFA